MRHAHSRFHSTFGLESPPVQSHLKKITSVSSNILGLKRPRQGISILHLRIYTYSLGASLFKILPEAVVTLFDLLRARVVQSYEISRGELDCFSRGELDASSLSSIHQNRLASLVILYSRKRRLHGDPPLLRSPWSFIPT